MDVFDLQAHIGLDTKDYESSLSRVKEGFGKLKGAVSTIVTGITAATTTAAAGITAVVKSSLDSVGRLEQLEGGVKKIFGDDAQAVIKNAEDAYITAGMSANEYMETVTSFSASLIQGLGGETQEAVGIADTAIKDMADNANTYGTDLRSIQDAYQGFAKQNYTMLDNLKLGYGGTKEEMARLINESKVLGDTLVTTGKKGNFDEVVSFDKIIEAIHVVQEDLNITGTTSKEAGATIEGSINSAKAAWDNFLSGAGDAGSFSEAIVGAAKNISKNLKDIVPRITSGLSDIVNKLAPEIPTLINELLPSVLQGATSIITSLTTSIPSLINTLLPPLIKSVGEIAVALGSALPDLFNVIGTVIPEILSAFGDFLIKNLPKLIPTAVKMILNFVDYILDNIGMLTDAAIKIVTAFAEGILDSLPIFIERMPEIVQKIVDVLVENIPKLIDGITQLVIKLSEFLSDPNNLVMIFEAAAQIVIAVVRGIWQMRDKLWESLLKLLGTVADAIINLKSAVFKAGAKIVDDILSGIKSVWNKIPDFFNRIWDAITSVFSSVSEWFAERFNNAYRAVTSVFSPIGSWFSARWSDIKSAFSGVSSWFGNKFTAAWTSIKNAFGSVKEWFSGLWEDIKSVFSGVAEWFGGVFEEAMNAVKTPINFIIDGINTVASKLNNVSFDVPDFLGGGKIGVDIPEIPKLAMGGVVNSPLIAQIGEAGAEAVVPLENNTGWIDRVADKVAQKMGGGSGEGFTVIMENVNIYSDDDIDSFNYKLEESRRRMVAARGGYA